MKSYLLIHGFLAALSCAAFSDGNLSHTERLSAGRPAEAAQMPDPGAIRREFMGTIAEVNSSDRSILVDDASLGLQRLHVDAQTRMQQGDKRAAWNDLKVGAMVDGTSVGAPGNAYAETLNIGR